MPQRFREILVMTSVVREFPGAPLSVFPLWGRCLVKTGESKVSDFKASEISGEPLQAEGGRVAETPEGISPRIYG